MRDITKLKNANEWQVLQMRKKELKMEDRPSSNMSHRVTDGNIIFLFCYPLSRLLHNSVIILTFRQPWFITCTLLSPIKTLDYLYRQKYTLAVTNRTRRLLTLNAFSLSGSYFKGSIFSSGSSSSSSSSSLLPEDDVSSWTDPVSCVGLCKINFICYYSIFLVSCNQEIWSGWTKREKVAYAKHFLSNFGKKNS